MDEFLRKKLIEHGEAKVNLFLKLQMEVFHSGLIVTEFPEKIQKKWKEDHLHFFNVNLNSISNLLIF